MSQRHARGLGLAIFVSFTLIYAANLVLLALTGQPLGNTAVWTLPSLALMVVCVVIVSRQPANWVGWLGFFLAQPFGPLGDAYATTILVRQDLSLPGAPVAAWLGHWLSSPTPMLFLVLIVMLYPSGLTGNRRWRTVFRLTIAWSIVLLACCAFSPINSAADLAYRNPLAAPGATGQLLADCQRVLWVLAPLIGVLAIWSLISRFRRAGFVERQQMKWLLWSVGALVVDILFWSGIAALADAVGAGLPWFIGSITEYSILVGVLAIVGAVAVAMLKYHLYDIDLIINRTMVYAALSAGLVLTYIACVLLLQYLLDPITQRSDLAVALSTLAVAGLFHPARSRIQALVNRRFYRQKYDAEHALEQFGAKAREEVDLEELTIALAGVIAETVQPRHVSIWLRSAEESTS